MFTGDWRNHLKDSSNRHRLTLVCVLCGVSYTRAADAVRHMQSHHGGFWRKGGEYNDLLAECFPQCTCNPSRPNQPRSHRCVPYRQISMIHYLHNPTVARLILPWKPDMAKITQIARLHPALHTQEPMVLPWLASLFQGLAKPSACNVSCALAPSTRPMSCFITSYISIGSVVTSQL